VEGQEPSLKTKAFMAHLKKQAKTFDWRAESVLGTQIGSTDLQNKTKPGTGSPQSAYYEIKTLTPFGEAKTQNNVSAAVIFSDGTQDVSQYETESLGVGSYQSKPFYLDSATRPSTIDPLSAVTVPRKA